MTTPIPAYTLTVTVSVSAVTPATAVGFMRDTLAHARVGNPAFDVQSIVVATPTRAAVAVVRDGYALGFADRDEPGYTPTTYTYDTYDDAKAGAALWNQRAGISPREAADIVLSTMKRPVQLR